MHHWYKDGEVDVDTSKTPQQYKSLLEGSSSLVYSIGIGLWFIGLWYWFGLVCSYGGGGSHSLS